MIGTAWLPHTARPRLHLIRWGASGVWQTTCSRLGELRWDEELDWPLLREYRWGRPDRIVARAWAWDEVPPIPLCQWCLTRFAADHAEVVALAAERGQVLP